MRGSPAGNGRVYDEIGVRECGPGVARNEFAGARRCELRGSHRYPSSRWLADGARDTVPDRGAAKESIVDKIADMTPITMYGAEWCGDCRRAKQWFARNDVAFDWVDLEANPEEIETVMAYNGGRKNIPVVVFADGSHITEPTDAELDDKCRIDQSAV